MTENWKDIKGFPRYQISDLGNVRSFAKNKRGRLMKPHPEKPYGHLSVKLCVNGKSYTKFIHHLVLEHFVGPRPEGMYGLHLDDDPNNNSVTNLFWGTQKKNIEMACASGKHVSQHRRKLTDDDVRFIRTSSLPNRKLAKHFEVAQSTIGCIKRRATYLNVS